ncbi:MAG TPA: HK97 family phage prohead protease [Firmicutes bacterium]|nr:HK97 family phage prohead protease [Bacillota bacterium]
MKEFRSAELNISGQTEQLSLFGRPILYDVPTTINLPNGQSYTEIIKRGALDDADLSDIRLLYNHDTNRIPLARTPKTMSFELDEAGLTMRANLPDTPEGQSVYTAVKRQDLSGMSFAFKVPDDGSHYDVKTNTRSISKISKVYEFSICPFPAYTQTSVEARSVIESAQQEQSVREKALISLNKILFKGE